MKAGEYVTSSIQKELVTILGEEHHRASSVGPYLLTAGSSLLNVTIMTDNAIIALRVWSMQICETILVTSQKCISKAFPNEEDLQSRIQ